MGKNKQNQQKKKENALTTEGVVVEAVGGSKFRVQMDGGEHIALCTIGGKLRKHYIRIVPGDRVKIELSPYDLTRGRIVYREK